MVILKSVEHVCDVCLGGKMKNKLATLVIIFTIVITTNFINLKGAEEQQPICNSDNNCSPGKWREYSCTTSLISKKSIEKKRIN